MCFEILLESHVCFKLSWTCAFNTLVISGLIRLHINVSTLTWFCPIYKMLITMVDVYRTKHNPSDFNMYDKFKKTRNSMSLECNVNYDNKVGLFTIKRYSGLLSHKSDAMQHPWPGKTQESWLNYYQMSFHSYFLMLLVRQLSYTCASLIKRRRRNDTILITVSKHTHIYTECC